MLDCTVLLVFPPLFHSITVYSQSLCVIPCCWFELWLTSFTSPLICSQPPFLHPSYLLSLCRNLLWILPFLALFHLSVSLPSLQRAAVESVCLWVQRSSTCLSQCGSANVSSVVQTEALFPVIIYSSSLSSWSDVVLRNAGRLCVLQLAIQQRFRTNKSAVIWLTHAATRFSADLQEFKTT